MKLTLSLLLVCALVMLCEARPEEMRRVVDLTAMGSGAGDNSQAFAETYEDPILFGIRSGQAFSTADRGISVAQSRLRTQEYQSDGGAGAGDAAPSPVEPTSNSPTMGA